MNRRSFLFSLPALAFLPKLFRRPSWKLGLTGFKEVGRNSRIKGQVLATIKMDTAVPWSCKTIYGIDYDPADCAVINGWYTSKFADLQKRLKCRRLGITDQQYDQMMFKIERPDGQTS